MALIAKNFVLIVIAISLLSSCKDLSSEEALTEETKSAASPQITKIYQTAQIGSDVQMNIEGVNLDNSINLEATINGKKVKLAAIETQKNGKNASFQIPSSVFQDASEAMMSLVISSAHAEDSADFTIKIKIQGNNSQEMSFDEIKKILRTDIEAEIRKQLLAEIIKEIKSDTKLRAILRGDAGKKGETGKMGLTGEKGLAGEKGLTGERGLAGEKGELGDRGLTGTKGDRGFSGTGVSNSIKTVLIDKDGNKLSWPIPAPNGVRRGRFLLENGLTVNLHWNTGEVSVQTLYTDSAGGTRPYFIEEDCKGSPYYFAAKKHTHDYYKMSTRITAESNAIVAAMDSKIVRVEGQIQHHRIVSRFATSSDENTCEAYSDHGSTEPVALQELILTDITLPDYSHLAPLDYILE